MKPFLWKTGLLSIILAIAYYLIENQSGYNVHIPLFSIILVFFYLTTNFVHLLLFRFTEKNIRKFNPAFLGLNMIKMFVYFLLALVYLWFYREYARDFLIALFIIYALFSILEIRELTRILKLKK